MSATLPILNAFKARLNAHFPDWQTDLMPNVPSNYYLSHPNGAILISYAGSKFGKPRPTQAVTQDRTVHVVLTVIARNLHNDHNALDLLDALRLAVVGFRPPNCLPCYLVEEAYDGRDDATGTWTYQLVLATETVQVEQRQAVETQPKFATLIARRQGEPLDDRLKPNSEENL